MMREQIEEVGDLSTLQTTYNGHKREIEKIWGVAWPFPSSNEDQLNVHVMGRFEKSS